jgi:opacity protein-like surface antigen
MAQKHARLAFIWLFLTAFPAQAQYGYGPSEPAAPLPPSQDWSTGAHSLDPQAKGMMSSGFLHVRDGVFFQLEGTTLSLGELAVDDLEGISTLDAETTYGLMATLGSIGDRGLGMEVAGGYYTAEYSESFSGLRGINGDLDARLTLVPMFVNLRFQLGLSRSLALEVAAGGGGVYGSVSAEAQTDFGNYEETASAFTLGYQGMIGVTYALGSQADVTLHYRRMMLSTQDDLSASSVGLGLRLRF